MSQQFNFGKNSTSPAGQALVAAVSFDRLKAVVEAQPEGRKTYEILFTCNGVEMDFEAVMDRMNEAYEAMVMEAARGLVKQKAAELVGACHVFEEQLTRKAEELFPEPPEVEETDEDDDTPEEKETTE